MPGRASYSSHVAGGLVRQLWPDVALLEDVIKKDPLLGSIAKDTSFSHEVKHYPLGWGASQGLGRNFADAKRFKSAATSAEFQVGTREIYEVLSFEGKLLRAAKYDSKNKALLVEPVKREGKRAIEHMERALSKALHGDGLGVVGRITSGSDVSTDTITLDDVNDLKNFRPNTPIEVEQTGAAGGTVLGEAVVLSVGSWNNPTVKLSTPWDEAFPGIAAGARLYRVGTYDNDFIKGLEAFNPAHSGTPGILYTCQRNVYPDWLAGYCMTAPTGFSIRQSIGQGARILFDNGGSPNVAVMSTRTYEVFEAQLESKVRLEKIAAADIGKYKMGVSYDCIVIQTAGGPVRVISSHWMPDDVIRVGELDTLVMGSIGPLVHWDDDGNGPDGNLRTEDQTDSRELRAVGDPAFINKAPGRWMRIAI